MTKVHRAVAKAEKNKVRAQLFRFARLTVLGIAAYFVAHNEVTTVAIVAAAEVAFRQVFD